VEATSRVRKASLANTHTILSCSTGLIRDQVTDGGTLSLFLRHIDPAKEAAAIAAKQVAQSEGIRLL
jgi:hypothetical protein